MTVGRPGAIRVLIVDDNRITVENVARLLNFEPDIEVIGSARNGQEGVAMTRQTQPDVVLMDINMPDMDGIEACRQIVASSPRSRVMMMSVQSEMAYLKQAMNAGAREFLIKPFDYDELVNTIRRVSQAQASASELAAMAAPMAPAGGPQIVVPERSADEGVLVAVYSPKGGVGCSTIAVNLAISLRGSRKADVLLAEGDMLFGDLDVLLDLHPGFHLVDIIKMFDPDDLNVLRQTQKQHLTGVRFLAGPGRPEMAELVQTEDYLTLLATLLQEHQYLVVDLGSQFTELTRQIIEMADRVVLVLTPELTAVKGAYLFLMEPALRAWPPDKLVLLLNKYDKVWGITPEAIGDTIGRQVGLVVPADTQAAVAADNSGRPVLLAAPRSMMVRQLLALERLIPSSEQVMEELTELARQRVLVSPPPMPAAQLEPVVPLAEPVAAQPDDRRGCARWIPFLGRSV